MWKSGFFAGGFQVRPGAGIGESSQPDKSHFRLVSHKNPNLMVDAETERCLRRKKVP